LLCDVLHGRKDAEVADIYQTEKRLKTLERKLETESILEENRNAIKDFWTHCETNNIGDKRIHRCVIELLLLARRLGDKSFKGLKRKDLEAIVREIELKDQSEWTELPAAKAAGVMSLA